MSVFQILRFPVSRPDRRAEILPRPGVPDATAPTRAGGHTPPRVRPSVYRSAPPCCPQWSALGRFRPPLAACPQATPLPAHGHCVVGSVKVRPPPRHKLVVLLQFSNNKYAIYRSLFSERFGLRSVEAAKKWGHQKSTFWSSSY